MGRLYHTLHCHHYNDSGWHEPSSCLNEGGGGRGSGVRGRGVAKSQKPKKKTDAANRAWQKNEKNKRADRKVESNDSPEIQDTGRRHNILLILAMLKCNTFKLLFKAIACVEMRPLKVLFIIIIIKLFLDLIH